MRYHSPLLPAIGLCALLAACGGTTPSAPAPSTTPPPIPVVQPTRVPYPWEDDVAREARESSWIDSAIRESHRTGKYALVIGKRERRLDAYRAGKLERTFTHLEMGYNDRSSADRFLDKEMAWDRRTPEGLFHVDRRLSQDTRPKSGLHRFLRLDYPTDLHRRWFGMRKSLRLIPEHAEIGNRLGIHGQGNDYAPDEHQDRDWTLGCVAVTNREIEWLYDRAPLGTPIAIVRDLAH